MDPITKAIDYAKTLMGVPYRWWRDGDTIEDDDVFWSKNGPSISRTEIDEKDKSIVCTGLINLVRRHMGLSIPGLDGSLDDIGGSKFPGTTWTWFNYLERQGRLEKLDVSKKYPKGTMVLRNFEHAETGQGHVAIIVDDNYHSILDQTILHAYPTIGYKESENKKDTGLTWTTNFKISHYFTCEEGYYTHVCLPENWILKE